MEYFPETQLQKILLFFVFICSCQVSFAQETDSTLYKMVIAMQEQMAQPRTLSISLTYKNILKNKFDYSPLQKVDSIQLYQDTTHPTDQPNPNWRLEKPVILIDNTIVQPEELLNYETSSIQSIQYRPTCLLFTIIYGAAASTGVIFICSDQVDCYSLYPK